MFVWTMIIVPHLPRNQFIKSRFFPQSRERKQAPEEEDAEAHAGAEAMKAISEKKGGAISTPEDG